ncbi:MAG: ComEC/Rec2 family competence protein [Nitrospira sp.]
MLPSLCVAFLLGLVAGSFLSYFPITLVLLLGLAAVGLAIGERTEQISPSVGLAWYGALCVGVIYWHLVTPPAKFEESKTNWIARGHIARIVAPVQHAPHRMTLLVQLQSAEADRGWPIQLRLTWREPDHQVYEGELISFHAKLQAPSGSRNPRGFDYAAYLEHQGIDMVATVSGADAIRMVNSPGVGEWRWRIWRSVDRWRGVIREAAIRSVSQPALGLFLGIVIGERGYLEDDLREWFMTTGTVHLLSISGSHLGFVALVLFGGIRAAVKILPAGWLLLLSRRITPTRLAILGTGIGTTFYTLLAGAEIATVRAWIMIVLGLAAVWMGSARRLPFALAGAAFLILLHDPRAVFDISFQLSFLSVLAMLWITEFVARMDEPSDLSLTSRRRYVRLLAETIAAGAAITVVTAPVVAWYFNQIPWLGLGTNLLAVPFTGFLLVPFGVCSGLLSLMNGIDQLPGAIFQTWLMEWLVDGLRWCAALPGADWWVASPLRRCCCSHRSVRRVRATKSDNGVASRRHLSYRDFPGMVVVGLGALRRPRSVASHLPRRRGPGRRYRPQFPGWADGLNRWRRKVRTVRYGARCHRPVPQWNHGIRRIDHVIATHPQQDHVGGLIWLIRHLDVSAYWHLGIERKEPLLFFGKSPTEAGRGLSGFSQPGGCRRRHVDWWC